ncbi:EcsC family protein [Bacillus sp. FJAT-45037]|uniref:EcsC family protein n=1 Tax=Bacillus sp. FJAT-45037 TaxID=2011007 RepID=UPI000C24ADBF|nr:EcsC family protein [Bacillus sp. FJAT-45037]
MPVYRDVAEEELSRWRRKILKRPSMTGRYTKKLQGKMNTFVPEKVHTVVSTSIKNMVQATLAGSEYTSKKEPLYDVSLERREEEVRQLIKKYKRTAAAEGAGTGAGGILLGIADFPLLLGIKMKFLYDTASAYGFDVRDYRERLFVLLLFQLAFSSDDKKVQLLQRVERWEDEYNELPSKREHLNGVDWKEFQLTYRDYIDLPKMLQMIPGFGAIVGAVANYHFLDMLGETAMNAYRLRLFAQEKKSE